MGLNWELKKVIFENGMSQRELAKKARIHESLISMAVRGKYNLDGIQKAKIAKAIGKPENEIFISPH